MNFQELLSRINELDQPMIEEPNEGNAYGQAVQNTPPGEEIKINGKGTGDIKREEVIADECGMGPMDPMKQQDNVSMSINMNGSGTGGIRDLLDILRDIENGGPDETSLGDLVGKMGKENPLGGMEIAVDEYANEPNEMYGTTDDAMPAGDDMHKPHGAYPATQLGDNPMAVQRIQERLESLYQDIKGR